MKSLAKLKDEARRYEQEGEWSEAIEAYLRVLKHGESSDNEVELPLYNRIGDLYVRLGEGESAVAYYETAADRYAEDGLFNNAIALCNKALRFAPDRDDLLRKLGQFSASQGFLTDARRWYLEYAERKFRAGDLREAFTALDDFANISDDPSIRELLGRRLHEHGRTEQAVMELKRAYGMRVQLGQADVAEALSEEIYSIDPNAGELTVEAVSSATKSVPRHGADDFALPGLVELADDDGGTDLSDAATAHQSGDADGQGGADISHFEAASAAADLGNVDFDASGPAAIERLADFESTGLADIDLPADGAAVEPDAGTSTEEDADIALPELPVLEDAPEFGASRDADAQDVEEPLPLVAFDGDVTDSFEGIDGVGVVEAPIGGESLDEVLARARAAVYEGRVEDAVDVLGLLHPQLAARGRHGDAVRVLDMLVELEPDRAELHQARVEALTAAADSGRLVEALVALGAALGRSGAVQHARAVYQQVLELEPGNAVAKRALQAATSAKPASAQHGEYVDLGAFLTADDEPVGDPARFFVEEQAPTGDEDRDFAELLSQFKAKIAENLPPDDADSHYDLGLAYKEMGLIDEAIGEFQVALRAGDERLKIYEELGHCFLSKGQPSVAAKVLGRALRTRVANELELIGVYYYLGRAYEELGERDRARDAYERVLGLEVGFRDVGARLARL
jgi:tetratricopeptide (TPR) repeat protein